MQALHGIIAGRFFWILWVSIFWLVIGAFSGWLAGQLVKGYGFGLVGNIVVGIVGAILGGWLFSQFGASAGSGLRGSIVTSVLGGVVLLFLVGIVRKVI